MVPPDEMYDHVNGDGSASDGMALGVLRDKLREVARAGRLICYSEVASLVNLDMSTGHHRRKIGRLLSQICATEIRCGRPMLGSVVVGKTTGVPGEGYFRGAANLGRFSGQDDNDRRSFWEAEVGRVHAYWSCH